MTDQKLLKSLYIGKTVFTSNDIAVYEQQITKLSISSGDKGAFIIAFGNDDYEYICSDKNIILNTRFNNEYNIFLTERPAYKHFAEQKIKSLKSNIEENQKEILASWDEIRDLNKHL